MATPTNPPTVSAPFRRPTGSSQTRILATLGVALTIGITEVILLPMKTAISIPDAVFEAAEAVAKRLGMSRSELYSKAVAHYVADHRADGVTERLNAVYGDEPAAVDSVLERFQLLSVENEHW